LGDDGRRSAKDSHAAVDREIVCTSMPSFEEALVQGAVSAGHVDALAHATRNLDEQTRAEFVSYEEALLRDAQNQRVETFERNCRDLARQLNAAHSSRSDADELETQRQRSRIRHWTDRETGMRHTHIELDPVRDAKLWAAIDHERRKLRRKEGNGELSWEQLQVEALVAAVRKGDHGERVVELQVLVDLHTLTDGLHSKSVCELSDGTALPVSTMRKLACEADIVPVVLDGNGRALDVGRANRLATEAQRQALRAMHRTCIEPDCRVPFDECRIHHVVPWERGGKSDLSNLAPLCESGKHHHLVHEGGWTLTMKPDRVATWIRPDGTVYWTGSTVDRAPKGVDGRTAE
jgi:hypothetical protein